MSELECPACERKVIAEVATADARVSVSDGYTVCDIPPDQHDEHGYRHYVHVED